MFREAVEGRLESRTLVSGVKVDSTSGNRYLSLGYSGGQIDTPYGTGFAVEAVSENIFPANQGDKLILDWAAFGGTDNYEVYGFLVDEAGNHQIIMYGRGDKQNWTTYEGIIPQNGNYRFRFVAGSHDMTGGQALDAILNVDNIRILNPLVTQELTSAIGKMVTYSTGFRPIPASAVIDQTTGEATSERKVNISLANTTKEIVATGEVDINITTQIQLELLSAVVEDITPNQVTLTFNLNIGQNADDLDLSGMMINGQAIEEVIGVDGKVVVVKLAEPMAPGKMELSYDSTNSDVSSATLSTNKLKDIIKVDNTTIPSIVSNKVVQLELIRTTTVPNNNNQLRLKFNKPINTEDLLPIKVDGEMIPQVIPGLTIGGKPVKFISMGDSPEEIIVALDEDYVAGDQLVYDDTDNTFIDDNNINNGLKDVTGTDLPIVSGKIRDFGLDNNGNPISLSPVYNPNNNDGKDKDIDGNPIGSGYWGVVPNDTENIKLRPTAYNPSETNTKIKLNGVEVSPDDNGWDNIGQLQEGKNTIEVQVFDEEDGTLLETYTVTIVRASNKLSSLVPSTDTLKPEFDAETLEYELSTSSSILQLTMSAIDPGADIKISLNNEDPISATSGIQSEMLKLNPGKNTITVTVTDSNNEVRTYVLTVYYSPPSSGDISLITVDVVNSDETPENETTKIDIVRQKTNDGKIKDSVTFTTEKAQESVDKALAAKSNIARIQIPDPKDEEDELFVMVPSATLDILKKNNIDYEIFSSHGLIRLPSTSLSDVEDDFYFRLIPVREVETRAEVEERAVKAELVKEVAGERKTEVVARPMTIHTNLSSRPVTLVLPLGSVTLPTEAKERQDFLEQLYIFIEHSDGDKELVHGTVTKLPDGTLGLQFVVNKFSTFTIVHVTDNEHNQYVNGYPDGTFKPDGAITRAEFATMLSRVGIVGEIQGTGFPDLASTHWANEYVKKAQNSGLINGYPDGEFKASRQITRAELATIAFNYLGLSKLEGSQYSDVSANHWANGIINALVEKNLMNGYEDGTFKPSQYATRAEAVTLVNRLANRGPLYHSNAPTWSDVPATHWAYNDIEEASLDHHYVTREAGGETKAD